MHLRSIRYFQAVAELGSYSRAAESLGISQPALSRQVRRLEGEVGRTLFARNGHGVTLTEPGRLLLERALVILRQMDQALAEVRSDGAALSGTVTLAVPPAAGLYLVPALTRRFAASHPGVRLKVAAGYSGYIQQWLLRGTVDLACLHDPLAHRGFEIVPLVEEEVFLVGRPGAFPFRRAHATARDLAELPLILPSRPNASRRLLDTLLSRRGIRLDLRMEVDDTSLIKALLKDGLGFSLLSQGAFLSEVRHGELAALPLRPRVRWPLALVIPAAAARPEPVSALAGAIRATVRDLTGAGTWPGRLLG